MCSTLGILRGGHVSFHRALLIALTTSAAAFSTLSFAAGNDDRPWMNRALDPDERARLVVAQMTREEKQTLVFGFFATDAPWKKIPSRRGPLRARPVTCQASRDSASRRSG